ncbi:unnamed protein product [Urochloa humidicola]
MEGEPASKRSRLEHHRGFIDGSSFHMEDLPEEIQPLVLSLLSLKEAARTSLVSKNWRKLWTRYPNLCFDGSKDESADMDSVKIERAKFIETVNSIIEQHSGIGLNKFTVRCSHLMESDILNRWICFAAASKAKIIDLNLWPQGNYVGPTKHVLHFPLEVLGAQVLRIWRSLPAQGSLICIFHTSLINLDIWTWLEEDNNKVLGHVFHGIPSVSAVKVLHVHASMHTNYPVWSSQVHTLTTRPACLFLNLRHLTYEILIFTKAPNRYSGVLQLSQYLGFAPQLETLELHMVYHASFGRCWRGEGVSYLMHRHDHLKTVYVSGFRCYRAQVELLCGILEMGAVLEQVIIEPMVRIPYSCDLLNLGIPRDEICEWAHRTSEQFGKAITVAKRPEQQCW